MTPKEKAKDIFDKFAFEKTPEGYKMFQTSNESKRCSLIAVNEIIDTIEYSSQADETSKIIYWDKVKKEIEKL
jgi:hypothetical protein